MENDNFADQGDVLDGFWDRGAGLGSEFRRYKELVQSCDQ